MTISHKPCFKDFALKQKTCPNIGKKFSNNYLSSEFNETIGYEVIKTNFRSNSGYLTEIP